MKSQAEFMEKLPHYLLWTGGLALTYILALAVYTKLPILQNRVTNIRNTTGLYGHSLLRFQDIADESSLDILFTGSSHTYRGFDPRIFHTDGLKTFNMGSSGQTPLNTYFLLEKYIEQLSPELIILDTYWAVMSENSDGEEASIDLSSNIEVDSNLVEMGLASKSMLAINSTFSNLVSQRELSLEQAKQREYRYNTYVEGGYVAVEGDYVTAKELRGLSDRTVKYSGSQLDYIEKIIKLAQKNGSKIILTRTPVTEELLVSVRNYEESLIPLQDMARKYNVLFIDFNMPKHRDAMGLVSTKHFFDKNHLNQDGVKIFNKYLLSQITHLKKP